MIVSTIKHYIVKRMTLNINKTYHDTGPTQNIFKLRVGGGGGLCKDEGIRFSQPRRSMYAVHNFSNVCKNSLTYDLFIAF